MILLLAIVQSEDVGRLTRALLERGFRLTQINSAGAWLGSGNVVLMLGVEEWRLPVAFDTIGANCQQRADYANATPWMGAIGVPPSSMLTPIEVQVGGAVVIGLPVERFLRFPPGENIDGGTPPMSSNSAQRVDTGDAVASAASNHANKLIVAVVHSEDADTVVDALLGAGVRLTRINTAGGFLRRGNATLLIGAKAREVDEVLRLIQHNCRPRSEPNPPQTGMPAYGATVFVLEASHFLRF